LWLGRSSNQVLEHLPRDFASPRRAISVPPVPMPIICRRLQTGRGWRHPVFTGKRPAPGRRARWLKLQGDRCVRYRRVPAMASPRSGAQAPTLPRPELQGSSSRSRVDKPAAVIEKSPSAGGRKAARGAGNRPEGGSQDPPWLRSRPPRPVTSSRRSPARLSALRGRGRPPARAVATQGEASEEQMRCTATGKGPGGPTLSAVRPFRPPCVPD
jgi:hypothetical protein